MNTLQQIEYEMLKSFVDVCRKLDLKYYLVCGTALGAVKYGGFIPWDDDVDVGMPRADYEVFCAQAQELLPDGLFVQNYHTEKAFPAIYSKLRNSNTTYIEKSSAKLQINHGVYIDIFPLDGYPKSAFARRCLEFRKRAYKLMLLSAFEGQYSFKVRVLMKVLGTLGIHKRTTRILEKYERMIARYPIEESALICNHGNWQGKLEYASREQYGEGVMTKFEGLDVRVPARYDEYLTQKYGDWRADLPPEQQVGHHYYEVLDCTQSYQNYTK